MTASPRRLIALVVAMIATAALVFFVPSLNVPGGGAAAAAEPNTPATGGGQDTEGGNQTLAEVLDAAGRGYLEAKAKLDASKKRQGELNVQLRAVEERLSQLLTEVGAVAAQAYRTGRLSAAAMLLNSGSPDAFLERAQAADLMAQRDDAKMRELKQARQAQRRAKEAIDAEVAVQAKQVAIMKKRKDDAEAALVAVGGRATGGFVSATSPLAKPAPRNPDGSWPKESCIIDDPTTTGCITPRTLNALRSAQADGFKRFVSCFRPGGPYEHPKGRACDYSAQQRGFGGAATGGDRRYGNDLAAYFVRNADRLGVLYVIWYRQIWFPGSGWRQYHGAGGASGQHTNHVHLSLI